MKVTDSHLINAFVFLFFFLIKTIHCDNNPFSNAQKLSYTVQSATNPTSGIFTFRDSSKSSFTVPDEPYATVTYSGYVYLPTQATYTFRCKSRLPTIIKIKGETTTDVENFFQTKFLGCDPENQNQDYSDTVSVTAAFAGDIVSISIIVYTQCSTIDDHTVVIQWKLEDTDTDFVDLPSRYLSSPESIGYSDLTKWIFEKMYPIGSIYMSFSNTSPDKILGIGTWEAIDGRFLYCSTGTSGETSGSNSISLSEENIPRHTHSWSGSSSTTGVHSHDFNLNADAVGDHTHSCSGSTSEDGGHNHNIKVSNSMGSGALDDAGGGSNKQTSWNGAHTHTVTCNIGSGGGHSHSISGSISNGGHSHTISGTVGNAGSGKEFSIMPRYITIYAWKRTK